MRTVPPRHRRKRGHGAGRGNEQGGAGIALSLFWAKPLVSGFNIMNIRPRHYPARSSLAFARQSRSARGSINSTQPGSKRKFPFSGLSPSFNLLIPASVGIAQLVATSPPHGMLCIERDRPPRSIYFVQAEN